MNSTTDHISAAGAWLKYKGHLSNISENTCESPPSFSYGLVEINDMADPV
jgi:homoaconitase